MQSVSSFYSANDLCLFTLALKGNGTTNHPGQCHKNLTRFEKGSKVKLTLNLLPDAEANGTLTASVDGNQPFQLFTNMRLNLESEPEAGFLPAVSLKSPARIRLVNIQDMCQ